jgi:hypothetical protein
LDCDGIGLAGGSEFINLGLEVNHALREAPKNLAIHGNSRFGCTNDGSVAVTFGGGGSGAKFVLNIGESHARKLDRNISAHHARDFGLLCGLKGCGGILHKLGELLTVKRHGFFPYQEFQVEGFVPFMLIYFAPKV